MRKLTKKAISKMNSKKLKDGHEVNINYAFNGSHLSLIRLHLGTDFR